MVKVSPWRDSGALERRSSSPRDSLCQLSNSVLLIEVCLKATTATRATLISGESRREMVDK